MKKLSTLLALILVVSGLTALAGCSSNDDEANTNEVWEGMGLTLTREQGKRDTKTVVEYFERNGMKFHLIDITERFVEARYYNHQSVPVTHVGLENLPSEIQTKARSWGSSGAVTKVFRMEYQGEYYYEISNALQSSVYDIVNANGKRHDWDDSFLDGLKNVCCILVLDIEVIKDAEGAPNYLVGIWQNDWQHLKHSQGTTTYENAVVALYPELPFSITEVMRLNEDGTGYLRTVKTYKDGTNEIALDPFRYELTDYHGGEQYGYHGYNYQCHFEAGDIIEYQGRSYDGMQTLDFIKAIVCYPWYKQSVDLFESLEVNAGQKYGLPAKDSSSPIVGRWTGEEYSEMLMKPITSTWVFRSDHTGYLLSGGYIPFAYTVSYNGAQAEVTIYKYNTGFTIDEGFANDLGDLTFIPTILPKGKVIKATVNDNSLTMDGWGSYIRQE